MYKKILLKQLLWKALFLSVELEPLSLTLSPNLLKRLRRETPRQFVPYPKRRARTLSLTLSPNHLKRLRRETPRQFVP